MSVTSVCTAQEQDTTKTETSSESFENVQQMMGPMMGQMMTGMMNSMFDVLSDKSNAEKLAEFTKNYYDALINKGFSKEDALKIVISIGIPSIPYMK
ncbi:MAG: hypothetical protein HYS25_06870 [Ignavibacteriales bacterium]|nr:hypothetical protein [Ignavibacteriales bacterium]